MKITPALSRKVVRVTKLDAAQRQLRTAIDLWFHDKDPVSIHALAFSAHEVIHSVFRSKGHKDLMFDSSLVREEFRKEFAEFLKKDAIFFKHARKDPDGEIEFDPEVNHLFITMSVTALLRMGEPLGKLEMAFNLWNVIHHPGWFSEQINKNRIPVSYFEASKKMNKTQFLEEFMRVVDDAGKPRLV